MRKCIFRCVEVLRLDDAADTSWGARGRATPSAACAYGSPAVPGLAGVSLSFRGPAVSVAFFKTAKHPWSFRKSLSNAYAGGKNIP